MFLFAQWYEACWKAFAIQEDQMSISQNLFKLIKLFKTYTDNYETIKADVKLIVNEERTNQQNLISILLFSIFTNGNLNDLKHIIETREALSTEIIEKILIELYYVPNASIEDLWKKLESENVPNLEPESEELDDTEIPGISHKDKTLIMEGTTLDGDMILSGDDGEEADLFEEATEKIRGNEKLTWKHEIVEDEEPKKLLKKKSKYRFLDFPPPSTIFGSILSMETIKSILDTKLVGEQVKAVLDLNPDDAWKFCDRYFIEYVDERRSYFVSDQGLESPIILEIRKEFEKLHVRPKIDYDFESSFRAIMTKIERIETLMMSSGQIKPENVISIPTFVPKDIEKPGTSEPILKQFQRNEKKEGAAERISRLLQEAKEKYNKINK